MIDYSAPLLRIHQAVPTVTITTSSMVPLFVVAEGGLTARETLLRGLRLSGVPETRDTQAIIDDVIKEVRIGFIRRLTWDRVSYLLALPYVSQANGDNFLRQLAALTETQWVRMVLMSRLPVLFQDTSGNARQRWQEDAPFRDTSVDELQTMADKLGEELEQNLEILAGEEVAGQETEIEAYVPSPSDPPVLRESIWPSLRR